MGPRLLSVPSGRSKRAGVERHGIRRQEVEQVMLGTGFNEVRVEEAFVLK